MPRVTFIVRNVASPFARNPGQQTSESLRAGQSQRVGTCTANWGSLATISNCDKSLHSIAFPYPSEKQLLHDDKHDFCTPCSPLPDLGNGSASSGPASPVGEEPVSNGRSWLGKLASLLAAPPIRLVKYGQGAWGKRSSAQAFYDARLALGQRMYRAGIDDGRLGGQIRDLEERINRATATQAPSKALKLQQQKLFLQLADAALAEDGPLPGADAEYQTARKLEAASLKTQIPRSV